MSQAHSTLSFSEFASDRERRLQGRLQRAVAESAVEAKTLALFDFGAVPQPNRGLVQELATCGFLGPGPYLLRKMRLV